MIKVEISDTGVVDAFNRLIAFGENPRGALAGIGEVMTDFTKQRFELSQDPYGNAWALNSDTTLRAVLHRSGKNFTKSGKLSKRGETLLASKKPLIGESRSLSTLFNSTIIGNDMVTVSSPMIYAAMMNYGGTKAQFPNLWGDIPARQFFPDRTRGLPAPMVESINEVLKVAIQNVMDGNQV